MKRNIVLALLCASSVAAAQDAVCDADFTLRRAGAAQVFDYWRQMNRDEARMRPLRKADTLSATAYAALSLDTKSPCIPSEREATRAARMFSFRGGLAGAEFRLLYGNNELNYGQVDRSDPSFVYHAVGGRVTVAETITLGAVAMIEGNKQGEGSVSGWLYEAAVPYARAEVAIGAGELDRATLIVGPFPARWARLSAVVDRVQVVDVTAVGGKVEATPLKGFEVAAGGTVELDSGVPRRVFGTAAHEWIWGEPKKGAWRMALEGALSVFSGMHVADYDGVLYGGSAGFDLSYQNSTLVMGGGVTYGLVPERLDRDPNELAHQTMLEVHLSAVGS